MDQSEIVKNECLLLCFRFFPNEAALNFHRRLLHNRKQKASGNQPLAPPSPPPPPPPNSIGALDDELRWTAVQCLGVQSCETTDPFSCTQCEASFSDVSDLQEHEECLHGLGKQRFECRKCDRSYTSLDNLIKHSQRHRTSTGYECDETGCSRTFRTELALTFHIRMHLGLKLKSVSRRKSHRCGYCPRRFSQRDRATKHESLHKQFPKVCPWCKIAFVNRKKYHKHCQQVHHTRDQCLYCPRKFLSSTQFVKHVNESHPIEEDNLACDPPEVQQYPGDVHVRGDTAFYYCMKCLDIFTSHRALLQHHHLSGHRHARTCVRCGGIVFSTLQEYESHYRMKHVSTQPPQKKLWNGQPRPRKLPVDPGISTQCQLCPERFNNPKGLGIHMGRVHGKDVRRLDFRATGMIEKAKQNSSDPLVQPDLATLTDPCIVTVTQEGNPIPISTSNTTPYTRILKVVDGEDLNDEDGTMRKTRKKRLHSYIYQLRTLIQDGLGIVLPNHTPPEKGRSYASYFEDILNLPMIQSCLSDMESVAADCHVTFSLPFPHNLVAMVWVNFVMSFERMKPGENGELLVENSEVIEVVEGDKIV